jgi:sulfite reductase beta subunit
MTKTFQGRTDIGPPHYEDQLPQIIKDNYGKWKYHERVKPGVLKHVSETGDELYTIRIASPRLLSITTLRFFADIADKYCDGALRFTSRHNVEFLVSKKDNVEPLIEEVEKDGWPIGGTGNAMANIIHTQGWVHCHSAATDRKEKLQRPGMVSGPQRESSVPETLLPGKRPAITLRLRVKKM